MPAALEGEPGADCGHIEPDRKGGRADTEWVRGEQTCDGRVFRLAARRVGRHGCERDDDLPWIRGDGGARAGVGTRRQAAGQEPGAGSQGDVRGRVRAVDRGGGGKAAARTDHDAAWKGGTVVEADQSWAGGSYRPEGD